MTTALAPYHSDDEEAPLVSLATGGLAAMVRLDGFDKSNGLVWYILRLAGATGDVRGRVVGALPSGKQVELGRLDVAPGAIGECRFAVPQLRRRRFAHIYLDLRSDDLALRLEAPSPPVPAPPKMLLGGVAVAVAGIFVACGGAFALAVPRAPVVAAPLHAAAGDTVRVAYAIRGLGGARYTATTSDGRRVSAGSLPSARGEIALNVPRKLVRKQVVVRVDVAGPLGRAEGSARFSVVPPVATVAAVPAPPPVLAKIASFSARRENHEGVESVLASYLAMGDAGAVVVTDNKGHVVGRSDFTRGGTSRVVLRPGAEHVMLTARLEVRRGASHASAAIGLTPLPVAAAAVVAKAAPAAPATYADAAPVSADEAPASADDPPQGAPAQSDPAIASDDAFAVAGNAIAGRPMTIMIRHALPGMHLRLADDAGAAVAEAAVPSGARTVALTPPAATAARTYYLTCTYGSGHAEEALVRSVRVLPH